MATKKLHGKTMGYEGAKDKQMDAATKPKVMHGKTMGATGCMGK